MEIALIEAALEEGNITGSFTCPHCEGYGDDEQYTCTTCWCGPGTIFDTQDAMEELLCKIAKLEKAKETLEAQNRHYRKLLGRLTDEEYSRVFNLEVDK